MGKIPSSQVRETWGEWRQPSVEEAREHGLEDHKHHEMYPVRATGVDAVKDFGEGHLLYFRFLKWMAQCFCLLALLVGTPQILLNILGRYYSATDSSFERSMLGNYGMLDVTFDKDGESYFNSANKTAVERELEISRRFHYSFNVTSAHLPAYGAWNKENAQLAMSIADMVGYIVYFLFTMYLIRAARAIARQADLTTATINDYTVWLGNLPLDVSEEELQAHLAGFGDIASVQLVRAYSELLGLVVKRGALMEEMEVQRATMQKKAATKDVVSDAHERTLIKLGAKLARMQRKIEAVQSRKNTARVVGAFVTFREETSKIACLDAYPAHIWGRLFMTRALRLRQTHRITVSEAPEPTDVQFQNIQYGKVNRAARRLFTNTVKYFFVFVGFCIISFASGVNLSGNMTAVSTSVCAPCTAYAPYTNAAGGINETFYAAPAAATYQTCFDNNYKFTNGSSCGAISACYECYCKTVVDTAVSNPDTFSYCSNYVKRVGLATSAQIGTVVVITVAGMVVKWITQQATAVEAHHTLSQEAQSATTSILVALFINTALSTMIANAYLPALQVQINKGGLGGILIQGAYNDLTPNWYKSIGKAILISIILKLPIRFATLCADFLLAKLKRRGAKDAVTQHQANEAMVGPPFDLAMRYGDYGSELFVGMFFAGGIPLFWFVLAANFTVGYWSAKWELFKLSKRPAAYSPHLAMVVHDLLPWAALPHAAFSLWAFSFFGAPRSLIVPGSVYRFMLWLMDAISGIWAAASDMTFDVITDRICQQNGAHHFVGFLFCLGGLLAYLTLAFWVRLFKAILVALGLMKAEIAELENLPPFDEAMAQGILQGITTYDITQQPRYRNAFQTSEAVNDWLRHAGLRLDASAASLDGGTSMGFFSLRKKPVELSGGDAETPPEEELKTTDV